MRAAAVLTISDSSARGERADRSGPATAELLRQEGFDVTHQEIVPDDQPAILYSGSAPAARGERAARSGPATAELLRQEGFDVTHQEIVPDDQPAIESSLVRLTEQVQLIVTTGGTGIADRDVTPEATRAVARESISGIPERMR